MRKRVVMIEDHTLVRQVLTTVLTERLACDLVATCGTLAEGIAACHAHRPDLVILDWMLPDGSGARLLEETAPALPDTRWLAMSAHENSVAIRRAIECGVHGFVMKQSSFDAFEEGLRQLIAGSTYYCPLASRLLADAIHTAAPADRDLTPRERQIIALYARGKNPKTIASELGVSAKTVQNQLTKLREKLGLYEPAELVRYAIDRGFA